jgi:hypothetical protein
VVSLLRLFVKLIISGMPILCREPVLRQRVGRQLFSSHDITVRCHPNWSNKANPPTFHVLLGKVENGNGGLPTNRELMQVRGNTTGLARPRAQQVLQWRAYHNKAWQPGSGTYAVMVSQGFGGADEGRTRHR